MFDPVRFWSFVDIRSIEECWPWMGHRDPDGYGQYKYGKTYQAHRVAFAIHHRCYPMGVVVRHTCNNPACCNPYHLQDGTQLDNVKDMMRAGNHRYGTNPLRGMLSPSTVLSEGEVLEIRRLALHLSVGSIAKMFAGRIGRSGIAKIISRKTWAHI